MDMRKLVASKEYQDARTKIGSWKERLEKGDKDDAAKVRDEKFAFFWKMRKDNPQLYMAFQLDDKTLSETIFKKLTGSDVTIE